ncbi:hypothetical protein P9112_008058 [Eukaryota sp. TZLM1-RC]
MHKHITSFVESLEQNEKLRNTVTNPEDFYQSELQLYESLRLLSSLSTEVQCHSHLLDFLRASLQPSLFSLFTHPNSDVSILALQTTLDFITTEAEGDHHGSQFAIDVDHLNPMLVESLVSIDVQNIENMKSFSLIVSIITRLSQLSINYSTFYFTNSKFKIFVTEYITNRKYLRDHLYDDFSVNLFELLAFYSEQFNEGLDIFDPFLPAFVSCLEIRVETSMKLLQFECTEHLVNILSILVLNDRFNTTQKQRLTRAIISAIDGMSSIWSCCFRLLTFCLTDEDFVRYFYEVDGIPSLELLLNKRRSRSSMVLRYSDPFATSELEVVQILIPFDSHLFGVLRDLVLISSGKFAEKLSSMVVDGQYYLDFVNIYVDYCLRLAQKVKHGSELDKIVISELEEIVDYLSVLIAHVIVIGAATDEDVCNQILSLLQSSNISLDHIITSLAELIETEENRKVKDRIVAQKTILEKINSV